MNMKCKGLTAAILGMATAVLSAAEPDGNEWQDQTRLSLGKEAPRAAFFTYPDEASAGLATWGEAKPWKLGDPVPFSTISLDYVADELSESPWRFKWSKDPASRPAGFQAPAYDVTGWDSIAVPCSWQAIHARGKFKGGWGRALYTNARYPFAAKPPRVMDTPPQGFSTFAERNPVGCYRRDFDVPAAWTKDRVFLKFDGVDSFFYLWVNGAYVGFSKDSRNPAEFDVTKFVRPGRNTVALEVYRYSDGSYLEDQDMFRLSGIFRHTWLLRRPAKRIRDFFVTAKPVREGDFAGDWEVNVAIDGEGEMTVALFEGLVPSGRCVCRTTARRFTVKAPKLWSAETPNVYLAVIGNGAEYASTTFGFRVSEVKNGRYYLNGQKIKLHGANRHETDPGYGHYVPRERILEDMLLLKRANCNAVRNSHYPQDDYWYWLCDVYGLYLVDEANMESHGMGYGRDSLAHRPEWRIPTVQRSLNMIGRNKNHPSVIIWSYGNESGHGENFTAAGKAVRAADPSRPRHYQGDNAKADIDSVMYPSVGYVWQVARDLKRTKPFYLCEYAHNMVNAMGNLKDYEDAIQSSDVVIGGTIWDWVDQGLYKYNEKGRLTIGFGGDFGDAPNDGQFVMNGCILSDRTVEPGYWEIRHVYQPFTATLGADGKTIVLKNRNFFLSGAAYRCDWTVLVNGRVFGTPSGSEKGEFDISRLAPRTTVTVDVPALALQTRGPGRTVSVRVRFVERERSLAMKTLEGEPVVAEDQIDLKAENPATELPLASGEVKVADDGKAIRFTATSGASYAFCRKTGTLFSACGKDGAEQLERPLELDAFRCPSSNEVGPFNSALAEGLRNLEPVSAEIGAVESLAGGAKTFTTVVEWRGRRRERQSGYGNVRAKFEDRGPTGAANTHFVVATRWTVLGDGRLVCRSEIRPRGHGIQLLRIGYRLALKGRDVMLDWFGNGPFENYADRKSGAFRARWTRSLDALFVPYARNEDSGNMEGTTRLIVTTERGGLECTTLGAPFAFQAGRWTPTDLILHTHPSDLPEPPAKAEVAILAATRGLGGRSCGPDTLERDIIWARGIYRMDFVLGAPRPECTYTQFAFPEQRLPAVRPAAAPNGLKAIGCSSFERGEGLMEHACDGDLDTFWHTRWNGANVPRHPHWIEFDAGASRTFGGLTVVGRQDGNPNGSVKDITVEVSADRKAWTAAYTGELKLTAEQQALRFAAPVTARYVKITVRSSHRNDPWAQLAEVELAK